MKKTLGELARLLGGELTGNPDIVIRGVAGLEEAIEGQISFLSNIKYKEKSKETKASAIIVSKDAEGFDKPVIRVDDPRAAYGELLKLFYPEKRRVEGVHPTVVMGKGVQIGSGASIGAHVTIEDHVEIGARTIIYPGVFIGDEVKIGDDVVIYPNAVLYDGTIVGNRVIIHAGAVLGSDGFGFATVDGKHVKIPQVGSVIIEDDVEIGANTTIDRATTGATVIRRGTKMDNLIQVGHNVTIGADCLVVAQVGIAGSTHVGDKVTLAGQAGIAGHLNVGDESTIMAQSGVIGDIPRNSQVFGTPARPYKDKMRIEASLSRLPQLIKTVRGLEKKLEDKE